ncbi:hypothetical protein ACQPWY_14860 [Pseudonocardia xinjiangensis]|uniref:hypothetical protein n=1 Tax=Pseudonocardia xinjiangensis TaxID=75289 RepID=UPI003D8A8732
MDTVSIRFTILAVAALDVVEPATYFRPSFTFERPIDDENTYVLDITRCLFHDGLAAAGRTHCSPSCAGSIRTGPTRSIPVGTT